MKNPCYNKQTKTDCPRRCAGCAINCPDWAEYVKERDARYKAEAAEREQQSLQVEGDRRRRKSKGYKV